MPRAVPPPRPQPLLLHALPLLFIATLGAARLNLALQVGATCPGRHDSECLC